MMLTPLDIEQVLALYDLGTLYSISQACRGYVNETAFIQTIHGRFVLRRNHRRLSEDRHRARHALIGHLERKGFPAPAIIADRNDETLVNIDNRFYEVMVCVNGSDYDPKHPRQLESIGLTLAKYHKAMQSFPSFGWEAQHRYNPQDVLALTERLLERDMMGELTELAWYDARAVQLRNTLPAAAYEKLPHIVIHGDIHRDNFIFQNDHVAALLDYDQAAWDARIVDLADALVAFASTKENSPQFWGGVFQGPLDERLAGQLIEAYGQVLPLTPAEITALPTVIELLWLQGELARVFSTPEGAPDYHQAVLEQGMWLSSWISERRERLISQWSRLSQEFVPQTNLRLVA
jgi:homoserine kinase type II